MILDHTIHYSSPIYLTEVLAIWLKNKLIIKEFASTYHGRMEGLSKLRFIDLFKAFFAVFEIAIRYYVIGFRKKNIVNKKFKIFSLFISIFTLFFFLFIIFILKKNIY